MRSSGNEDGLASGKEVGHLADVAQARLASASALLGDCYESITDDCAAVLEQANRHVVGDELKLVLDGLGAMRSGHFRSAQAMFTDALIYRFYPDQAARRLITNRKKGADVPGAINEMSVHEAMVWLPI